MGRKRDDSKKCPECGVKVVSITDMQLHFLHTHGLKIGEAIMKGRNAWRGIKDD
jgi:hypothetical protein